MNTLERIPTNSDGWENARRYISVIMRRRAVVPLDAEDITNIVLQKLYANRARIETNFRGYMSAIARNEIALFYRRKAVLDIRPITEVLGEDVGAYVLGAGTPVYAAQSARNPADVVLEREAVQEAIALLRAVLSPAMLRIVALLAQGLTNAEAALRLGCSAVHIRVTKHRAKLRLQAAGLNV